MKINTTSKLLLLFILPALALQVNSCKKGEEDPFISFRCRKARMTGDWKMVSGTTTDKSTDLQTSITVTTVTNYDGSNATETTTIGSSSQTTTYPYTYSLSLKKDGTFTMTETDNGASYTTTGKWDFTIGNGKDLKKKEQIILYYNTYNSQSYSYSITGYANSVVMNIIKLKNKELSLSFDYTSSDASSTDEYTSRWDFEQ